MVVVLTVQGDFIYIVVMAENSTENKVPSRIIFDNLRELVRAKNTAHESMFKFHWKKMWPFCLIWPQVDFNRIVRLMGEIRRNIIAQENLVAEAKPKAKDFEKDYFNALPAYLKALDTACKCLADAAQWKQDFLERKLTKDVKVIRDTKAYNEILKAYEKAENDLVMAGAFVQNGWIDVVRATAATKTP
mgnify:CR=1 FL=1